MDDLHSKIRALWVAAGSPSTRDLARDLGGMPSHTTIAETLSGKRTSSRVKLRRIIEALDGNWADFEPLYPARPVRTVTIRHADQPDVQVLILEELRAIRALLETERQ